MLPGDFISSLTLNPPSPVEIGRTVATDGVQTKAANGDELGATN